MAGRDSQVFKDAFHYTTAISKRPAGRAPRGKAWCALRQQWVDAEKVQKEHVTKKMFHSIAQKNKFRIVTAQPDIHSSSLGRWYDSLKQEAKKSVIEDPHRQSSKPEKQMSNYERIMHMPFTHKKRKHQLVMVHGDGTNDVEEGEWELQEVVTEWSVASPVCYLPQ